MTLSLRDPRSLDELLNYRLTRLQAQSGAPVVRLLDRHYGISRREWRLVALLALHGALSPSALADEADLDRPRTSRTLGALLAKGLATREPVPGDARQARVALTEAGRHLYDEVFPQVAALNARLLRALDEPTLAALDRALALLTDEARTLNAAASPAAAAADAVSAPAARGSR